MSVILWSPCGSPEGFPSLLTSKRYQFPVPHYSQVVSINQSDHDGLASAALNTAGGSCLSCPQLQQVHSISVSIAKHVLLFTEELLELRQRHRVDATGSKQHLIVNPVLGTD